VRSACAVPEFNFVDRSNELLITVLKAIPILLAAVLLGNWFLAEVRKAKATAKPWYAPYLTIPGILIIITIMIPIFLRFFH
jgi:hypothetical protein